MNLAKIISLVVYVAFGVTLLFDFVWLASIDTESEAEVSKLAGAMLTQGFVIMVVGFVLMVVVPTIQLVLDAAMHGQWQPLAKSVAFVAVAGVLFGIGYSMAVGTDHFDNQKPELLLVGEELSKRIGGAINMGYYLVVLCVVGIVVNFVISLVNSFGGSN